MKSLTYLRVYQKVLLKDRKIPVSNNLHEANINPFATARSIWLFVDTPKGFRANAALYTLVKTAKVNGLSSYKHLKSFLEEILNNDYLQSPYKLDFPWSLNLPDHSGFIKNIKKASKDI